MTVSLYSRRTALGLIGASFAGARAFAGAARPKLADPSAAYQVPGGRMAFTRPQGVAPTTNGWILQCEDHTFQIRVQETALVPGQANPMWDKDPRSWISGTPVFPGFSARRFKNMRYGNSLDNGTESIVLIDAGWAGEVSVLISNLTDEAEAGGLVPQPGGLVEIAAHSSTGAAGLMARWGEAATLVLGSITVRPAPTAETAMMEFGCQLDTAGLNPRFAGDRLVLSAQAPRSPAEALGTGLAHIALPSMSNLDYIAEDANTEMFEFFRMTGTELSGGACRGFQSEEKSVPGGHYATSVRVFGRRRQQEITAVYGAGERAAALQALDRTFRTLRFLDEG